MKPIPKNLSDITPAWLSDVLSEAGIPDADCLSAVHIQPNTAFNSPVAHLKLEYNSTLHSSALAIMPLSAVSSRSSAVGGAPSSVLIKLYQHGYIQSYISNLRP